MTPRPWLASTTSGALGPETASFSVVLRSSKDFATRLILTLGYLAWNCLLSSLICAAWPPRTSWSQTVSVTLPALLMSGLVAAGVVVVLLHVPALSPPGVPQPAASAVAPTAITAPRTLVAFM